MSKRFFVAALALSAFTVVTAPAHARIDNGPVASPYEADGRKLAPHKASKQKSAKYRGQKLRGKQAKSTSKKRPAQGAALKSRAMTASHSGGGGGGGASRGCLTPAARALLGRIESQFGAVQVISTCRPGARIAGTNKISKHASGNAVDFNAGGRKSAIVNWLRANHTTGGTMTYARMNHIHVDIGPRFVSLGSGGGRRG